MKSQLHIFSALTLIFVVTSCYYDNEEALYPVMVTSRACDTVAISYTTHVSPIIAAECNVCHSTANAPGSGGNIVLEGYTNLKKSAISGKLLGAISHNPGFTAMPKGANKLSYCEITYIRRWIEANTPNN